MLKILVAEDDKAMNGLISTYLKDNGYQVKSFFDGQSAFEEFNNDTFSMVISDIMMPIMDGFELCEKIRSINKNIPIIFMTAKDDKPSKLFGFKLGVDDYIVKPFDIDVLMLKVKAILRRVEIDDKKMITVGNLIMNYDERVAYVDGAPITLTVREFDILFKLLSYPKKTFTRSNLMDEFWDYDSSATSRTVDVYMAKIREKTASCNGFEILTVHGLGYKAVLK